ncbi:DEAD/DEAH box helicase family protein [Stenotrophomonas maltophilia]|uniref:DEAD/DEAH box helicase family protein n=1 Tax=Stenotrophomonas maltophilia TaxID=40324 RepID=UPI0009B2D169|nr:DEAD/DEAH box helicase family protein [Stenotrophomonas maltophilia]MBH1664620.1 DEAD/DEAH box helicase family protein [Stenotrophomonas maltophilia]
MVDFSVLNRSPAKGKSKSLIETFSRLDRKVSHVELRSSQVELFKKIDARIDERDLVLKLTTGGGKTTTGLIYLKQKMDDYCEPVVFLVPTLQLAEQVIEEGERIGVPVVSWPANVSYPPDAAVKCTAVMVCTYDKFFNGKSTFARSDVRLIPCAIVLDDVHAGIESLRKSFSAELSSECRADLIELLEDSLKILEPANWTRIEYNDPDGLLEVPHWIISENEASIRAVLQKHSSESPLLFAWPYLSREVGLSRIVISGEAAAISLDPPVTGFIDHYTKAKHRLFMSASVHDGASLIRELSCDANAAANPIEVEGEVPVGERMVLVPTLIDPEFDREAVLEVARAILRDANVVVLVSSEAAAKFWTDGGATMGLRDEFSSSVARLKATAKGTFVVFVNRYDGIDLPDSACRLLVIDGLPSGDSLIDLLDAENAGGVVGMRGKVANRVEQGLGRAVRSNSDYCAVILSGADLATFVSRKVVLNSFSPATVRQIDIGREISQAISLESDRAAGVVSTVSQLLSRNAEWRGYYESRMSSRAETEHEIVSEARLRREVATSERRAADLAAAMDYAGGAQELRIAANLLGADKFRRGIVKQAASKLLYKIDKTAALALQSSVYADNCNLSRPPVMPTVAVRRISSQAERLSEWLKGFADRNGAVVFLDALRESVKYSNSPGIVEAAMQELGVCLGADSSRPDKEYGRGPDNLWIFGDRAICLEMKSDKTSKLWKDDAGQIVLSESWVREHNPGLAEIYPLIGSDIATADRAEDFPERVRVLDLDAVLSIISKLRGLVVTVVGQGPLFLGEAANIQGLLGSHELLPQQIVQLGLKIRR